MTTVNIARTRFKLPGCFAGTPTALTASWAPVGDVVVSAGQDQSVQMWHPETAKVLRTFPAVEQKYAGTHSLAHTPDGKTLISGTGDGTARLWDSASGRHLCSIGMQRDHAS
jgi:WD40 repeat protein